MAMTEERLAALETLCHEATAGPWTVRGRGGVHMDGSEDFYVLEAPSEHRVATVAQVSQSGIRMNRLANAELMAESRTALPELIAEVRRLRGTLSEISQMLYD